MEYKIYQPETASLATNLWGVNIANLIGDVSHEIETLNNLKVCNAERITVQVVWSGLTGTLNGVFQLLTRVHKDLSFVCEQTDESELNATQKTLNAAAGNVIFHLVPANYQALNLFLEVNGLTGGSISVAVSFKF